MTARIAERVRELRKRQDLSTQALADRCAALGMPDLNRRVLSNLENDKRRYVTVAELFVLAEALHTAPAYLLQDADDAGQVEVLPNVDAEPGLMREWLSGRRHLRPMTNAAWDAFVASAPPGERMRLRARGEAVVKLASRLVDLVTLAVQRRHADAYWTPDRIADELDKYMPAFVEQVEELTRGLRAEGDV